MGKENKNGDRDFYPHRGFTCSDEVWEKLKANKLKNGGNWTNFLKDLNGLYEKYNQRK